MMRGKFYEQFGINKMISEAVNKKSAIRAFQREIDELKKARRIREKTNIKDNFIEINCDKAEDFVYYSAQHAQRKKDIREVRQVSAKMNRDYMKEETYRKNVLSLSKWDFLRMRKAEADEFVAETLRQRRQMTKLLIMRTRHDYIVELYRKFRARVEEIRMRKLSITMAMKIKRQTKKILLKKGKDMQTRERH